MRKLVLDRKFGVDDTTVLGARQKIGQAVIILRTDNEIDAAGALHDFRAFGLGDAARDRDHDIALAGSFALGAHFAQPAEFGIDLVGRLLADMAGVENDEVGVFRRRGLDIAFGRQRVRHALGVVDVHLTAIGPDEELLWM
jgi:hypothetical protein